MGKKVGRPKKENPRSVVAHIRFTTAQWARLKVIASQHDVDTGALIYKIVTDFEQAPPTTRHEPEGIA